MELPPINNGLELTAFLFKTLVEVKWPATIILIILIVRYWDHRW